MNNDNERKLQQQGEHIEHFDVKTAGCDSYFRQ